MEVIYKYELSIDDEQCVDIPAINQILSIQVQNGKPCMWVKVDTSSKLEKRYFKTVGTGNPIHFTACCYVGTYQVEGGALVFHVFETHDN